VDRETVDRPHAAALEAGGTDNGAPGVREITRTTTAATSSTPDGKNIEAVCRTPA
jgi:hypothetical protein